MVSPSALLHACSFPSFFDTRIFVFTPPWGFLSPSPSVSCQALRKSFEDLKKRLSSAPKPQQEFTQLWNISSPESQVPKAGYTHLLFKKWSRREVLCSILRANGAYFQIVNRLALTFSYIIYKKLHNFLPMPVTRAQRSVFPTQGSRKCDEMIVCLAF